MTAQHEEALEVPTTEPTDDRSLSPTTTISATLADAPLEASGRGSSPVAPAKPDVNDLYSPSTSPNGQFAALAAQSASSQPPPPSNPPPPATLMAALGTTKAERPTLCAYNVGGAHGAAAVAVCGLTIQAPSGACALHSPPYSPSPHVASPSSCLPPLSDSLHRPHSADDAMLSPHTPWMQTRTQSRLPGMLEAQSSSGLGGMNGGNGTMLGMGNGMTCHAMGTTMGRPPFAVLTAEQQRVRMISNFVMERLCVWGEYRTVGDWPQELVAHGSMPAVTDALQASPTHSLTIPQLVTAVKERTGNAHGGKALDMLNLKAYVRCFPASFHLRSGRTAAGRPLDVVELRIESHERVGMPHSLLANGSGPRYRAGLPVPPPPTTTMATMQSNGVFTGLAMGGHAQNHNGMAMMGGQVGAGGQAGWGVRSAPQPPHVLAHGRNSGALYDSSGAIEAARAASPACSNGASTLQPKELFASASDGDGSPRSLWGSPTLASAFSLFGFSGASSTISSPSASPSAFASGDMPSSFASPSDGLGADPPSDVDNTSAGEDAAVACKDARIDRYDHEEGENGGGMLAQIDALFSGGKEDGEVQHKSASKEVHGTCSLISATSTQQAYIKRHELDKVFAAAVDRAMRHQVASPIEFIAHELLRTVQQC